MNEKKFAACRLICALFSTRYTVWKLKRFMKWKVVSHFLYKPTTSLSTQTPPDRTKFDTEGVIINPNVRRMNKEWGDDLRGYQNDGQQQQQEIKKEEDEDEQLVSHESMVGIEKRRKMTHMIGFGKPPPPGVFYRL